MKRVVRRTWFPRKGGIPMASRGVLRRELNRSREAPGIRDHRLPPGFCAVILRRVGGGADLVFLHRASEDLGLWRGLCDRPPCFEVLLESHCSYRLIRASSIGSAERYRSMQPGWDRACLMMAWWASTQASRSSGLRYRYPETDQHLVPPQFAAEVATRASAARRAFRSSERNSVRSGACAFGLMLCVSPLSSRN